MPKVITKEQQSRIQVMLQGQRTLDEIMGELDVSKPTILKIKKDLQEKRLPASTTESPNETKVTDLFEVKNTIARTKSEEKFLKKLGKEAELFEDTEEGWVYSITKGDRRRRQSGYWWGAIVYPESAPEDWIKRLRATYAEIAISPLHDKDTWEHDSPETETHAKGELYKKGDKKKAHWHIIVKFDVKVGYFEANELIQECTHGPCVQKITSLKGAYEYFIHLNNPERYQYERTEIQKYNGFVLEPNRRERTEMLAEVTRKIRESYRIVSKDGEILTDRTEPESIVEYEYETMSELVDAYINASEYINIITTHAYSLKTLLHENYRHNHPESDVKRIRMVDAVNVVTSEKSKGEQ